MIHISREIDLSQLMRDGAIIDNRREFQGAPLTLKDVLSHLAKGSSSFKTAVGYFYIEGLSEVIFSLKDLDEVKILMGSSTSFSTKEELIEAFRVRLNAYEVSPATIPSIALFRELVQQGQLNVRVLYSDGTFKRLHSKAYLFIRDLNASDVLERFRAGVIGSSNLTPSGLVENTELNVIIDRSVDLAQLEDWFEDLWSAGSEEFDGLTVSEAIVRAIDTSHFQRPIQESLYEYLPPREFFIALVQFLHAEYLFEDWGESGLFRFQVVDTLRCLRLFRELQYRGLFLTSSVGLGKSYVACKVADIYRREGSGVLIVAPANLCKSSDQWPRYLREFSLSESVDLVSMGELQRNPDEFMRGTVLNYTTNERISLEEANRYSLIIVDEAHNYRSRDAYRTRNLRWLIDRNGDSRLMFLTATPINTSLEDLLNLLWLFHRSGVNPSLDALVRDLTDVIGTMVDTEFEDLTDDAQERIAEVQYQIERDLFVKSTRETLRSSEEYLQELEEFSGVDLRNIPDPDITPMNYTLHRRYRPLVNNIISFIDGLNIAHLRLIDPSRGVRLGGFFKWLLYKRFESSITSYYLTLRRLAMRNEAILEAIEDRDITHLTVDDEDIDISFGVDFRANIQQVIERIISGDGQAHEDILVELRADTESIRDEISKVEPHLEGPMCFRDDKKMKLLERVLTTHREQKILVFTQYKDTLDAIEAYLRPHLAEGTIKFISSAVSGKDTIVEQFNDSSNPLRVLITTDTLSEGYNISGADIVVNFDIPYNPVRIIQRIGRATRLDTPKLVRVFNFRPDADIDRELELVQRMDLRIKDIIRFVGVDYRIWIDRANESFELLRQRRTQDVEVYHEVLRSIREDMIQGNHARLEVPVVYTRPTLVLLQRAINQWDITGEDVSIASPLVRDAYTSLHGPRSVTIFQSPIRVFNEQALLRSLNELEPAPQFFLEHEFSDELRAFWEFVERVEQQEISDSFYTGPVVRMVHEIREILVSRRVGQVYSSAQDLLDTLQQVRQLCGSTTPRVLRELRRALRSDAYDEETLQSLYARLQSSFSQRVVQATLEPSTSSRHLALVIIPKEDESDGTP